MHKKVKDYFKGKNPYLLASAAIVIITMTVICLMLKVEVNNGPEVEDAITDTLQSRVENVVDAEGAQASREPGTAGITDEQYEESVVVVKPVQGITGIPESSEPDLVSTTEPEKDTEEPVEQDSALESEETLTVEVETEQEEPEVSEADPDSRPEDSISREPENAILRESEVIPTPESMETPEVTPTPVQHEHSWLFQSFYQEPTCSNGGLVNQICAHCGETQTTPGTPTGKHAYEVETAGDCCTAEVVICSECNHREVREKNRKNHIDEEEGFCYGCGQKTD